MLQSIFLPFYSCFSIIFTCDTYHVIAVQMLYRYALLLPHSQRNWPRLLLVWTLRRYRMLCMVSDYHTTALYSTLLSTLIPHSTFRWLLKLFKKLLHRIVSKHSNEVFAWNVILLGIVGQSLQKSNLLIQYSHMFISPLISSQLSHKILYTYVRTVACVVEHLEHIHKATHI